jgi:hypothetical protein
VTPEGKLKKEVDEYLTSIGAFFWKPVVTAYSVRGVDYVGCYKGRFFAIETKVKPRKPTGTQIAFLVNIYKAGGIAIVAYDLAEVQIMLDCSGDYGRYSEILEPWIDDEQTR